MNFTQELGQHNISYQDYSANMQTITRAEAIHRRADYSWAFDDAKVRRVIATRIAVVTDARKIPETLDAIKALDELALDFLDKGESHNRMGAAAARRVGGLTPYWAALIYRCIRLGQDSVTVANEFKVSPWGIRQTLYRLNFTAKQIECGENLLRRQQKSFPRRCMSRKSRASWNINVAIKMRVAGYSHRVIAAKCGVSREVISAALGCVGMSAKGKFPSALKRGARKCNHELVVELRREGFTYRELAERFKIHINSVFWICNRSGVAKKVKAETISAPALSRSARAA
jgi:hypothetical protein